jgi:ABC-type hemin transport system ATPase subunit
MRVALVELRGVSRSFGGVRALSGVDLQLWPGQVIALVGENGAGKSTLVKILTGVEHPDAGRPTTVGIAAAARVVSQANKCNVVVTGLGLPNQMREFVNSGCVKQFALWSFEDLGYLSACAAHHVLAGDITGKSGDSFDCGKLGKKTIGDNGTVTVGEPLVFTKDNIAQYQF